MAELEPSSCTIGAAHEVAADPAPIHVPYFVPRAQLDRWLSSFAGAVAEDEITAAANLHWVFEPKPHFRVKWTTCPDKTQTYRFTVADECGNTATSDYANFLTVAPPPLFKQHPRSQAMESDGFGSAVNSAVDAWLASNANAKVATKFANLTWSHTPVRFEDLGCVGNQSASVQFTAEDTCGRTVSGHATFAVIDTTPPHLSQSPVDMVVQDDGAGNNNERVTWLDTHGGGQAIDLAAAPVAWTHDYGGSVSALVMPGCQKKVATTTFTASDQCQNKIATTVSFAIVDHLAPRLLAEAADLTLEIVDAAEEQAALNKWSSSNGGAKAVDYMNGPVHWNVSDGVVGGAFLLCAPPCSATPKVLPTCV